MVALGRASITPTPGSDHGPKREEPSDVRKIGDAPDKKETRRAPFVPPRTENYSDRGSFWTYRASERAVTAILFSFVVALWNAKRAECAA